MADKIILPGEIFEEGVRFDPAWDRRAQGFGIHGVEMHMFVRGHNGFVVLTVFTGWHIPNSPLVFPAHAPIPERVRLHMTKPTELRQEECHDCRWLGRNQTCYSEALSEENRAFMALVKGGHVAAFAVLRKLYWRAAGRIEVLAAQRRAEECN